MTYTPSSSPVAHSGRRSFRTSRLRIRVRYELSPHRILRVPSVSLRLKQSSDVEIFHGHGVVLADEPCRYLVLVVQHLPTDVTLDFGDPLALFFVVARPLRRPRQVTLIALESVVLVFNVEPIHSLGITEIPECTGIYMRRISFYLTERRVVPEKVVYSGHIV